MTELDKMAQEATRGFVNRATVDRFYREGFEAAKRLAIRDLCIVMNDDLAANIVFEIGKAEVK